MKKLFLSAAMVLTTIVASAQFMQNSNASNSVSAPDSFGALTVSYNPVNAKFAGDDGSTTFSFHGISLGWTNANKLSATTPLYVQYGLGLQWSFRKDEGYGYGSSYNYKSSYKYETSYNFLSVKAPISLLFNLNIPGTKVYFAPYAGLDAVFYVLGKCDDDSFFDGDSSGYGYKMSRFNLDWHVGGQLMFNKFLINIAYEGPIVGFYNKDGVKLNSSQVNLGIGFIF